jgi:hypothetical protein
MNLTMPGLGCPDCSNTCHLSGTPDPIELNKETYRTRKAVSSVAKLGGSVLRNYSAGAVVGKFEEATTYNGQLWFRTTYGGWLPYIYDNYYYANLKPGDHLTSGEKIDVILNTVKNSGNTAAGAGASIVETAGDVSEGVADVLEALGKLAKNLKWVLIIGGAAAGYYYYNKHIKAKS